MNNSGIRILYLGKYAPISDNYLPTFDSKDGIAPIYHHEIYSILKQLGYDVKGSRSLDYLYSNSKKFDFVFSLYNRMPFKNSEIFPSALCEYLKIPYLGGSPVVRSIAEDKNLTKILANYCMVLTPDWTLFNVGDQLNEPNFPPPFFIKPRYGAASEAIDETSLADSWTEAQPKIIRLLNQNLEVIVEQFIPGINITVPAIFTPDILILPPIECTSIIKGNILTYNQKRMIEKGIERKICNNKTIAELASESIQRIYRTIADPIDYARFDFRYDPLQDCLFFLEFNVCSNLGSHSTICQAAGEMGISQVELVDMILKYSLRRQQVYR